MNILLFGATGAAGGAVLRVCLETSIVADVRAVARRPVEIGHPKLHVVRHDDYLHYDAIADAFGGVDACFFCLGVSATRVDDAEYRKISHDMPLAAARMLHEHSPDAPFHYITGRGTNPNSRMMWARVKGEAERELIDRFGAVCWRPAAIDAPLSPRSPRYYRFILPFVKLMAPFPGLYVTGEDLGKAMLRATIKKLRGRIVENPEIQELAARMVAL